MPVSCKLFVMHRILLRSLWITLLTIAVLLFAVWQMGRWHFQGSVMAYEGRLMVPGLDAPAEILFDARGIPQVWTETDGDAFFALGWLHAGERLFQMELIRRVAHGRLAEVFGEGGVPGDAVHRSLELELRAAGSAEGLSPEARAMVSRYVTGVNRYMESAARLPPEFTLLRFRPEPWSLDDVMTVALYQTWYPNTLASRMSEAYRDIVEEFGADTGRWLAAVQDWSPPTVPAVTRMTEASNSWVVAPERSASGRALHASDPHLDISTAPGMWYAAGLRSAEGLNVLGVTVPGLPFVAMGHNGFGAWAFTVAPVDVYELYREELHPEDDHRVRGPRGWETVSNRMETIPVKNHAEPATIHIEYTPRGLVVDRAEDHLVSMRWAGFDFPVASVLENALAIHRASDFTEFRRLATDLGALSVNWTWSDAEGNIGYVLSTPVPRRRTDYHFGLSDAADPNHAWNGYYAPDELPWALNPEQGWLSTNNNQVVDGHWHWPIPGFYKFHRIRRAVQWLSRPGPFDAQDMRRMQLDRVSDLALSWKDWLAEIAQRQGRSALAERLQTWDGDMHTDSDLAGLFARWWGRLPETLFADLDDVDWRILRNTLEQTLMSPPVSGPFADLNHDRAAGEALERALADGAAPLGEIQTLTIHHPLSRSGIINRWLNLSRGPMPYGGDTGSLNVSYTRWNQTDATLHTRAGASMRFVMDWADPDAFTLNLTLGQSGHPLSPHFDDFLEDFLSGAPWTVPFRLETVESAATRRLTLVPL